MQKGNMKSSENANLIEKDRESGLETCNYARFKT